MSSNSKEVEKCQWIPVYPPLRFIAITGNILPFLFYFKICISGGESPQQWWWYLQKYMGPIWADNWCSQMNDDQKSLIWEPRLLEVFLRCLNLLGWFWLQVTPAKRGLNSKCINYSRQEKLHYHDWLRLVNVQPLWVEGVVHLSSLPPFTPAPNAEQNLGSLGQW